MNIERKNLVGKLTSGSREELMPSTGQSNTESTPQTIVQMRDGMGWPAKDITTHSLLIEDAVLKGHIPVRVYRKEKLKGKVLPVLVYYHGGGFFGGSIQNVEQICRTFADRADLAVVSVGYRLSPENPFPAGLMDCYKVVEVLATEGHLFHISSDKIFVAGDSAGGNLAISVAIFDASIMTTGYVKKIVSYYPVVDLTSKGKGEFWDTRAIKTQSEEEKELVTEYINGFSSLEAQVEEWYCGASINRSNELISPLFASDKVLSQLPPLKIIVGEFDPLRQQVESFAEKLLAAKTEGSMTVYPGVIHAFMDKIGIYDEAEEGILEGITFLKGDN